MTDIYTSETLGADIVQVAHHGLDRNKDDGSSFNRIANFYKMVDPDHAFFPVASHYIKDGENNFWIDERAAYSALKNSAEIYIAADDVVVLTLNNGSAGAKTYADVTSYVNS